ncbi:ATPase, T2SS/T4P/T4SS family [Gilvimarinus sp. SDUM040013]|uniref:ATPase, T2SS/T4P/T4SS family n=1 Tax=Gilvimarinus gilvus TaxID=3058038 RepID=A0ABU4RZQ2_9GAMM|nr:ATPase, T2SS/T4P/T4SS family [Gilvimarinus sp. SDUM040013]MDO3386264.1 ATPase, T2SS/T4P/T4SS family [Gilvimarinus sp. SDUM040013]MDX6849741.1 ATPase, T2SS/T4P/T4SS family [Gilvimarinus sp. SDUM040013]
MFEIKVSSKDGKWEESVRCGADSCEIGRSRDVILRVRGWKVAPKHLRFEKELAGVFVVDISRGAGATVNGETIERYGPIASTDTIEFGGFTATVQDHSPDQEAEGKVAELSLGDSVESAGGLSAADSESERTQLRDDYMTWAKYVHKELVRQMDLKRMQTDTLDHEQMRSELGDLINTVLQTIGHKLPPGVDRERLKKIVLDETVGLGALEQLLDDPETTEVMVNAFNDIYIERAGRLIKSDVSFTSDEAVMATIERIVSPLGRRIDESSPMVDARLRDGSRVNAIIPPLALRGPCITIRKFSDKKLTDRDLIRFGSTNEAMVTFMKTCVEQRCNAVVSGGTGSGKTTLLNILSNFIPMEERVVTVEDAAELRLVQPHVVSLEARPANMEGKGQVTIRDLVKNCLRMRPDRIVVGECRGGEALDMLQAMNTGHDGSLTTAHANSPRDMLRRLEVMVLMAGMDLPVTAIREQVASAVDIVIQQTRFGDGSRRVSCISEITGIESNTIQLTDIFRYQQTGFDENGKVLGKFMATGIVPSFYEELRSRGVDVDMSIFKT